MNNFEKLMKILTLTLFCLVLSCSAASAANIVIDKQTGPAESGIFHTPNYASDAACIQAALDSSKSGDTITICAGDYYIKKPVYQNGKSLNIIGDGKVTIHIQTDSSYENGISFAGTVITSKTLSTNAKVGSSTVTLTDASKVRQNDLIKIWKNVQWCPSDYPDQMTGEIYSVKSVNGNVVTLNQPLLRDYSLSESTQVEVYRPIEMHIENIRVEDTGATMRHHGLVLQYCKDSSVSDSYFDNSGFAAICLYSCFNVDINDNEIYNSLLPGSGYGVNVASGSAFINIENNHIENCRHAITGNSAERKSLNRDVLISNNNLIGASITGSSVVDAHAVTIDFVVSGNKIYPQPSYVAFSDGTKESTFSNNEIIGGAGGIVKRESVSDGVHTYDNNVFNGITDYMYRGGNGIDDTLIIKNNIQNSGTYGVYFPNQGSFRNIIISGNSFRSLSYPGVHQKFLISGVNLEISGNSFANMKQEGIYIDGNSLTNGAVKIQNNILMNVNAPDYAYGITTKNLQNAVISGNQIYERETSLVPVAAFSSSTSSGYAPLAVTFTDRSTNSPTSWSWNFGDGKTSTLQNPSHTYSSAGTYTVTLTASNAVGSNTVKGTVQVKAAEESAPEETGSNDLAEIIIADNRLRETSADYVYKSSSYIDVGGMSTGRYRDVMQLDLSSYEGAGEVDSAVLSLYWYYPSSSTRPEDTVIEIYRPASSWNPNYVSWNKRDSGVAWKNAGGDWYDKNGVLQGSTPYATITIIGSKAPDYAYHEIDITDLVNEYISGKSENTGLLIKARSESNNYVAFYSSDWGNENQQPKLEITKEASVSAVSATVSGAADNRLREGSPSTVYQSSSYIDVGGMSGVSRYRDLISFDLSKYAGADVSNAALSLYWYYPSSTRPEDTVLEVYRPASSWNTKYVSWTKRDSGISWKNAGGDWYDKNGVLQGSTPYATLTIKGSSLSDNKYYKLDVTDLVNAYTSGKYENTGFLIKARSENNNYIAFYSSDCGYENKVPVLQLEYS